jgi:hypothetical protein
LPNGQILKSKEPYHVVPHMKNLDECFPDQVKLWRYDVITKKLIFIQKFIFFDFHLKIIIIGIY